MLAQVIQTPPDTWRARPGGSLPSPATPRRASTTNFRAFDRRLRIRRPDSRQAAAKSLPEPRLPPDGGGGRNTARRRSARPRPRSAPSSTRRVTGASLPAPSPSGFWRSQLANFLFHPGPQPVDKSSAARTQPTHRPCGSAPGARGARQVNSRRWITSSMVLIEFRGVDGDRIQLRWRWLRRNGRSAPPAARRSRLPFAKRCEDLRRSRAIRHRSSAARTPRRAADR